jgi:hypothetical protein
MRGKIFIVFFSLLLFIPPFCAARAATPSLELTPEELVRLLNGVADASAAWPAAADGKKARVPDPAYGTKDGRREFSVRLNPVASIAGPVDPESGHMLRYSADLLLSDAETIAALAAERASAVRESARVYGAVCASLLLLNADTADEFAEIYGKCQNFFAVDENSRSKTETLRVNRHVSMRFTYTNRLPQPYVLRRVEVFPTK